MSSRGLDWKNSRMLQKLENENKLIYKLDEPIGGKVASHVIDKIVDEKINQVFMPKYSAEIKRVLRSLG